MKNDIKNNNVLSVLSLVFGIVSILLFLSASINDYVGIFGSAIGIGLGIAAIVLGKTHKKNNKSGMSTSGIVTGIIGICICSICFLGCTINRIYVSLDNYEKDTETVDETFNNTMLEIIEIEREMCKDKYKDISYSSLSRNPNDYKSECIHFKGEVIQALEDFDTNQVQLRVNTKLSDYSYIENSYYDDTIYVYSYDYDQNNRILENDIIDLYGMYNGIVTYDSVMGTKISIPSMTVLEYSIEQ